MPMSPGTSARKVSRIVDSAGMMNGPLKVSLGPAIIGSVTGSQLYEAVPGTYWMVPGSVAKFTSTRSRIKAQSGSMLFSSTVNRTWAWATKVGGLTKPVTVNRLTGASSSSRPDQEPGFVCRTAPPATVPKVAGLSGISSSLLAPVMAYNYMGEPLKYARIAQALGENTWGLTVWEAAELAVDAVARLTADVGIPTLSEMGIPKKDVPMLAELAFNDPQTIGNPRDIDKAGYEQIYLSCFED